MGRQIPAQRVDDKPLIRFRGGVSGEHEYAAVGRWEPDVEHLNRGLHLDELQVERPEIRGVAAEDVRPQEVAALARRAPVDAVREGRGRLRSAVCGKAGQGSCE